MDMYTTSTPIAHKTPNRRTRAAIRAMCSNAALSSAGAVIAFRNGGDTVDGQSVSQQVTDISDAIDLTRRN